MFKIFKFLLLFSIFIFANNDIALRQKKITSGVSVIFNDTDSEIKNIKSEVYQIESFQKYQDAPAYPKKDFISIANLRLLGSSNDSYIAYLLEKSIFSFMSGGCYATLIIQDIKTDTIIYTKDLHLEKDVSLDDLYKAYKKQIITILQQYSIEINNKIFFYKNTHTQPIFRMKKIFKKTSPIGFGNFSTYLEKVEISMYNHTKMTICNTSILDNGKKPHILNAEILGYVALPKQLYYAPILAYVHTNGAEGNSVDFKIIGCKKNLLETISIQNTKYKSLYQFCKQTGYKEKEIKELNPWINKNATNIVPNTRILVPNKKK